MSNYGSPDPLVSVTAKLDRAEEHRLVLRDELNVWLELNPPRLRRQRESENVDAWICESDHQVPIQFSVLMGDVLSNARAALDHLAFVACDGMSRPRDQQGRIQFPIFDRRKRYRDRQYGAKARMIGFARPGAKTVFESLQPYKRSHPWHERHPPSPRLYDPHRHPLYWLAVLSNIDKHRHLHFASMVNEAAMNPNNLNIRVEFPPPTPFKPGAVVLRYRYAFEVPPPEVRMNPGLVPNVFIDEVPELAGTSAIDLPVPIVLEIILGHIRGHVLPPFRLIV